MVGRESRIIMAKKFDVQRRLMIGRKFALARDMAGLKQEEVMVKIFGTSGGQKNRISEIENGKTMPDAELFQVLCELYVVSADWILGFTVEPEMDKTTATAGILYNSLGDMLTEFTQAATAQITMACARHITSFPKADSVVLLEQAKVLVKACGNLKREAYEQIQPALIGVMESIRNCDQKNALQIRNLEIALDDVYQREEAELHQKMLMDLVLTRTKRYPSTSLPKADEPEVPQIGLDLFAEEKA